MFKVLRFFSQAPFPSSIHHHSLPDTCPSLRFSCPCHLLFRPVPTTVPTSSKWYFPPSPTYSCCLLPGENSSSRALPTSPAVQHTTACPSFSCGPAAFLMITPSLFIIICYVLAVLSPLWVKTCHNVARHKRVKENLNMPGEASPNSLGQECQTHF